MFICSLLGRPYYARLNPQDLRSRLCTGSIRGFCSTKVVFAVASLSGLQAVIFRDF